MSLWPLSALLFINVSLAAVTPEMRFKDGVKVDTKETSKLVSLMPAAQLSLDKHSSLKVLPDAALLSKGTLRLKVTKAKTSQKVEGDGIEFSTKDAEFEVSAEGDHYDLAVVSGTVQVSSPYVQTFVPETVKANEGFRFNKKEKSFSRKPFMIKFSGHPGFAQKK